MKKPSKYKNLLEDIEKSLEDPVYGVAQNFSLDKSEEFYNQWVRAWNKWFTKKHQNPAIAHEKELIPYNDLNDLTQAAKEANILMDNLCRNPFYANVDYKIQSKCIEVHRNRLRLFEEWLDKGLRAALNDSYINKYNNVKLLLSHQEQEWFEWRNIEEDIKEVKRILYDRAEDPKEEKTVTVLQLKI